MIKGIYIYVLHILKRTQTIISPNKTNIIDVNTRKVTRISKPFSLEFKNKEKDDENNVYFTNILKYSHKSNTFIYFPK